MRPSQRLHRVAPSSFVVLFLSIVVMIGCDKEPKVGATGSTLRPECPGASDSIALPDTGKDEQSRSRLVARLAVPGPISTVPEFHDCQAFAAPDASTYSPLYAIYARFQLESAFSDQSKVSPAPSNNTSTVATRQPAPTSVTTSTTSGGWVTVAEVLSYGGTYSELEIEPGINCLFLRPVSSGTGWEGRMVHVLDESRCLQYDPANPGKPLNVVPRAEPNLSNADYPPVARWDWDPAAGGRYTIGILCQLNGAQWCTVSKHMPVGLSQNYPTTGPANARRVREVRGWYDEQRLATMNAGPVVTPTRNVGTVFPDPGLDARKQVSDFEGSWVLVASVSMRTPDNDYKKKLNFDAGTPMQPMNRIYMMHQAGKPETEFRGMIVSANGDTTYHNVIRRVHPTVTIPIPGVVRWRWKLNDETIWVSCAQGCCEVENAGT